MTKGFFDYQSGAPVDPRVLDAMIPYMTEQFGNPASLHSVGDVALEAIDRAREQVAALIGAGPREIVFTSGATEASNLALKGAARRNSGKGKHIVSTVIEHRSVMTPLKSLEKEGFEVTYVPVDHNALVSPEEIGAAIRPDTVLVSVMTANGEVGTIQPVGEIAALAKERGALFHTDAVAAEAWVPLDAVTLPFDLVTLSSNDIYGPKGVGALYIGKGTRVEPLMLGGGQERGLRSGSENVAGIVGFGKAAQIMASELESDVRRVKGLRDRLIDGILGSIPDAVLNGPRSGRVPNNVNVRIAYVEGESLILLLDMEGVQVSSGSACTAKTLEPSYVQLAMGIKHEEAHGSLQFTLGRWTTEDDVEHALRVLPGVVEKLRGISPLKRGKVYDKSKFSDHEHEGIEEE